MMNLLFLTFSCSFFRYKRITKICLEQMFVSGPTLEATDLKNVIATGKRSLVIRLVCGPLLVIAEPLS